MPQSRSDLSERLVDGIGALVRRTRTSATRAARSCGLHPTQAQLLFALSRLGECRVAHLAELQLVDPSVVSRQIASLEKLDLIERRADPEDARAALVSLNDAGRAKVHQLRGRHREALTAALGDWPVGRITGFVDDLHAFVVATGPVYDELAGQLAGAQEVH